MDSHWSDLLPDLLMAIACLLISEEDFTAFRGVCTAWRKAATKDIFAGEGRVLLLIPARPGIGEIIEPVMCNKILAEIQFPQERLAEMTIIGVGFGWLMIVENDGEVHLWNSKYGSIIHLPNFRLFPNYHPSNSIQRGVLSDNPLDDSQSFELAVIVNGKLGFWKSGYPEWTKAMDLSYGFKTEVLAENMCYHNGALYIVNSHRRILVWDPSIYSTNISPVMVVDSTGLTVNRTLYLVESSAGELLLITRTVQGRRGQERRSSEFGVVLLDLVRREWNEIHNLGNDAVFIGNNAPITVPAYATLPSDVIMPNCIYFTDDNFGANGRGLDTGVCDVADESILPFDTCAFYPFPPSLWLDNAKYFKKG